MSQRLLDTTRWLVYFLALQNGYFWAPAESVTVRTPPSNPATIQAQAKFFQDFFSVQLSPYKIEFGHVCEDPNTWEQRYEKKDFKNHRDMGKVLYRHLPTSEDFDQGHRLGSERHFTERHERSRPSDGLFSAKVRWGDKKGGYGEHYWDLNHAGHAGNHEGYDDDGSYHEENNNDHYEEPDNHNPSYGIDEYDSDKSSNYDESGRAKRAHPRPKPERTPLRLEESKQKNREILQTAAAHHKYSEDENEDQKRTKPRRQQYRPDVEEEEEYTEPKKDRNQVVLVVTKKDDVEKESAEFASQKHPDLNHYVPYEGGAGVRLHQQPDTSAANNVPRLFLEPSTGHVVDRATGQAYVLQPINIRNYN